MEITITILSILLVAFALLAMYDGVYLHLIRYKLFQHPESRFEHFTHTVRAILFPFIIYFLFLETSQTAFFIGVSVVFLDIVILIVDAYSEKDSRRFMGGLPRWEYIIHLLVNGFHFASIAVVLVMKLDVGDHNIRITADYTNAANYPFLKTILVQLIPGSIIIAAAHLVLMFRKPQLAFSKCCRINCCS